MPVFIVDGEHEQRFLQRICGTTCVVRQLSCNGKQVSVEALAKRAATLLRLLQNKVSPPFIICVDLEGRQCRFDDFADQIKRAILRNDGICVSHENLIVGVSDRMTENWIVAGDHIDGHSAPANVDGMNGAAWLKQRLPHYHKTTLGVELLSQARASEIRLRSASFRHFHDAIQSRLECHWLRL